MLVTLVAVFLLCVDYREGNPRPWQGVGWSRCSGGGRGEDNLPGGSACQQVSSVCVLVCPMSSLTADSFIQQWVYSDVFYWQCKWLQTMRWDLACVDGLCLLPSLHLLDMTSSAWKALPWPFWSFSRSELRIAYRIRCMWCIIEHWAVTKAHTNQTFQIGSSFCVCDAEAMSCQIVSLFRDVASLMWIALTSHLRV